MTRIVHLASSGALGGAERVILDVLRGLLNLHPEWALHLVVPVEGPLAERARAMGLAVTVVPWSSAVSRLGDAMTSKQGAIGLAFRLIGALPGLITDSIRMSLTLRRLMPSIVHAHGFKMHLLGRWTRPRRTPVVLHLHDYVSTRTFMSRALAIPSPGHTAAIAISRSVCNDAQRVLGLGIPIEVVYNGIDANEWSPAGSTLDLDAAAGLAAAPVGTVRVGLVATMARWKGQDTFLRAMALLPKRAAVRGYVIGGSIYETDASQHTLESLRTRASALGLDGRVGFTGFVEDPVRAMRSLDIVVHASVRPEPFGRVIIEGMATGAAVVARPLGGAAELFVPGTEAMACLSEDPQELADLLARLSSDQALRGRLGENGRARVQRDFSRERMVASIARVYTGLLPPGDPHPGPG